MRHTTDSLVSAGEFALARARLLSFAEGRSVLGAARWEREWARTRASSLAPLLALDAKARAELVAAGWPPPSSVRDDDAPDWARLKAALERQLDVRRRLLPADALDIAETLTALALLERTKGDGAHAVALQRDALRIRIGVLGPDSPEAAESHLRIGKDLRILGAPQEQVTPEVNRAMAIRRRCFGEHSHEYAEVLADLANVERWRRRIPAALRSFEELLELRRRLDGPQSLQVAKVLTDMAVTHLRDEDYRAIEKLSGEAVAIFDRHGSVPDVSYALALNMHGLGLRHVGRLAEAERELQRTIVVQEMRRRASPDLEVARGRFYRLSAYGDLATVQILKGDSLAAWGTQERGLSRRWLERAFARGELDTAGAWDRLLERVQAKLDDSSAVIGWLDPVYQSGRHGRPCWGFVIRKSGGVQWARLELAADDPGLSVHEVCLKLRRQLGIAAEWPSRIERWDELDQSRHACWRARFAPLEPLLSGVHDLVVVSPQVNHLVPLEVLLDANGRALGERFSMRYESSALRFVNAPPPERVRRAARNWRAILVAAHAGEGAPSVSRAQELRWAGGEIASLRARLASPLVLEGRSASESRVRALERSGELGRTDLLHIVSHGKASVAWGSEVWLALAEYGGGATRAREHDGLLELGDLDRWNVQSRLVVLSSCWSGGNAAMHSEGAMGLGQGLIHAGARSVLSSVWPVDDAAALHFMDYFYGALLAPGARPCSIAEALREAQLRLREHRAPDGSLPYAHPRYWGGFVLLGDAG